MSSGDSYGELHEVLEEYVDFARRQGGDEVTEYWQALHSAAGSAASAGDYENASKLTEMLKKEVLHALDPSLDGWLWDHVADVPTPYVIATDSFFREVALLCEEILKPEEFDGKVALGLSTSLRDRIRWTPSPRDQLVKLCQEHPLTPGELSS